MKKLYKTKPSLDKQYYKSGVYAQPIHHSQNKQTPRLFVVAGLVEYIDKHYGIQTITDLGCGDGGLISLLPSKTIKGIDLAEKNVEYAKERFKTNKNIEIIYEDFTKLKSIKADLVICCETLEHLVHPKKLLTSLECKYLITSVPMNENQNVHSEHHLWAWNEQEFQNMINSRGFKILHTVQVNKRTQVVLAEKI